MNVTTYTASQIARALGVTRQSAAERLARVPTPHMVIVGGNETTAWSYSSLPVSLQNRLSFEADRQGFRNVEALLSSTPGSARPPMSLNKISDEDLDHARKLREAIRPLISQRHDLRISSSEMEARGVADFKRFFGYKISGRYWRKLMALAIERDAGAEAWDRLELYLPAAKNPKEAGRRSITAETATRFSSLESYINACRNPVAPSEVEQRQIWLLALEKQAELVRQGEPEKRAARMVREFLFAKASFLAPTREALWLSFKRKLGRLVRTGGDPKSLRDRREENGQPFQLPESDRDLLIHRAVFHYRGHITPAWRDLLKHGFSEVVIARYGGKAASKSHVPASVRASVEAEVEFLTVLHQGKRAFDNITGHVERIAEGIPSLTCMSADDFTMPVYFYVPDGNGWFTLTRGQILVFIDYRSLCILGFSIQPDRNYSSLTIRSLCTHVFGLHGVPEVLQFERGIWESSSLLKGRAPAPFGFSEVVNGLREFGIKFVHSIRPRSKTVERVGGLLQDLMEAEPGYCGRNERKDAPESLRKQMAAVESRNTHPSKHFYSYDQWAARFEEIVNQYNAAAQEGRILKGRSPDDALAEFADPAGPMQFGAGLRYLLAHDKRVCRSMSLNGITIRVGKTQFNYRGAEIAHLVGRDVLSWFDPENPETLVVTDMQRRNPVCVARSNPVSGLECITDPGSGRLAQELQRVADQASYMKARFKAIKAKHPMPQRLPLPDANTIRLGQQIETVKAERNQQTVNVERNRRQAHTLARKLNVPAALVNDNPETLRALKLMEEAEKENRLQLEKENEI